MELLKLIQGSPEWLATRLSHFTASEAAIMMGDSPHMSRDELLTYKTTTVQEEVDSFTQRIYDKGHALEEMARPIVERIIGQDLYPVTGRLDVDGLPLLGSYDGLTMMQDLVFEHKQWNAEKAKVMSETNSVLLEYAWQLEQLLLVSDAKEAVFVMSDGAEDNFVLIRYESIVERRAKLIAGWKQFAKDLVGYEPKEYKPAAVGTVPDQLPSLSIQLMGEVKSSNLAIYEKTALQFIESISTDLATDEDFATAEKTIKFCDATEKELEVVKKQALSQTEDIATLFATVDTLKEAMRSKRLELNKLVKHQKEQIRQNIVVNARQSLMAHIEEINARLDGVVMPVITADFDSAIKGKRTIKSLEEAANDELARAKIQAADVEVRILRNLSLLNEKGAEYKFLFRDLQTLVLKDEEDFAAAVTLRIADYEAEEKRKAEAAEQVKQAAEVKPEAEPLEQAAVESPPVTTSPAEIYKGIEVDIRLHLKGIGLSDRDALTVSSELVRGKVPHCGVNVHAGSKAA